MQNNAVVDVIVVAIIGLALGVRPLMRALKRWRFVRWVDQNEEAVGVSLAPLLVREGENKYDVVGLAILANQMADQGNSQQAVDAIEMLFRGTDGTEPVVPWYFVNTAVNVFVNAGRYQRAVDLVERWPIGARESGRQLDEDHFLLAQINHAEALHNLGRNEEAVRSLDLIEPECGSYDVSRNGLLLLRAWILAHVGQLERAQASFDAATLEGIAFYTPEYHYTGAVIALRRGIDDEAQRYARLGLDSARRAASVRNGLFMLGLVAQAAGRNDDAIDFLQQGEGKIYKGQSAPGLIALAKAYSQRGEFSVAREVLDKAIAFDPESYACEEAKKMMSTLPVEPKTSEAF